MTITSEQRSEISRIIGEACGAVSVCWEHIDRAGVFQSTEAARFVDQATKLVVYVIEGRTF